MFGTCIDDDAAGALAIPLPSRYERGKAHINERGVSCRVYSFAYHLET
jgi:hypothetical protein